MRSELKKSINVLLLIFLIGVGAFIVLSSMNEEISFNTNILNGDDVASMSQAKKDSLLSSTIPYKNTYIAWIYGTRGYEIMCVALATCAYAFTYVLEKKSGMLKNILLRTKTKTYFIIKAGMNFIIGGLVSSIPIIILFIVCFLGFDDKGIPSQTLAEFWPTNVMSEYFGTNPIIYVIFFTSIVFFIGGVYSTIAMAIGAKTNNIVAAIILPNLFWFFGSLLLVYLNVSIQPWDMYYFMSGAEINFTLALSSTFILLLISLYFIYKDCKSERLL